MADDPADPNPNNNASETTETTETTTTTMELSLRLDSNGRTAHDPALRQPTMIPSSSSDSTTIATDANAINTTSTLTSTTKTNDSSECHSNKRAKIIDEEEPSTHHHHQQQYHQQQHDSIQQYSAKVMDYSSKTILTNLATTAASTTNDDRDQQHRDQQPAMEKMEKALEELLFDCQITDCGLLPRTFWVPATTTTTTITDTTADTTTGSTASLSSSPRCYLEKMALEIFHHHVPSPSSSSDNNDNNDGNDNDFYYDPATSGAEWWVQLRPSPPVTGRYSMLSPTTNNNDEEDMTKTGISFHWDKDEDLRLATSTMHIHPHVSTVTYLTDLGAPTMVLSERVDPMTGEYLKEMEMEEKKEENEGLGKAVDGFVSWPRRGKHLSFDGRFLHAAPSDLMKAGAFERQCKYDTTPNMDETAKKILDRKHRRVTFLVNIWLNYKPFNVNPFPETMIGNLSKVDLFGKDFTLFGDKSAGAGCSGGDDDDHGDSEESKVDVPTNTLVVVVSEGKVVSIVDDKQQTESSSANNKNNNGSCSTDSQNDDATKKLTNMTWPMGQKDDETIQVLMPVEMIRSRGESGSDVVITWKDGVVLGGTGN